MSVEEVWLPYFIDKSHGFCTTLKSEHSVYVVTIKMGLKIFIS